MHKHTTVFRSKVLQSVAPLSLALALVLTSAGLAAQDQGRWEFSSGLDYSTGDYGGDAPDTEVTYLPFSVAYQSGNWEYSASFAHVTIDGAGTVLAGDGIIPDRPGLGRGRRPAPGAPADAVIASSESGLGDTWLEASYFVDSLPTEAFYLELAGRVKIPTADESLGLGTGATDYTLQAELYKPVGNMTPFLTVGYKIKGDPDFIELDNVPFVSVGSDFSVSDTGSLGFALDYQQAAFDGGSDYLDLMGYFNHELDSEWGLTVYGYKGLAEGSPDFGAGVQLSYQFGGR